jgi:hypothetical protein
LIDNKILVVNEMTSSVLGALRFVLNIEGYFGAYFIGNFYLDTFVLMVAKVFVLSHL